MGASPWQAISQDVHPLQKKFIEQRKRFLVHVTARTGDLAAAFGFKTCFGFYLSGLLVLEWY